MNAPIVMNEKGSEALSRFVRAEDRLTYCERELNSAQTEKLNAENALCSWLLPKDAKAMEKFAIPLADQGFLIAWRDGANAVHTERRKGEK